MTPENYVPAEKDSLLNFQSQLKDAGRNFLSTVYGCAITPYRVPTAIRKYFNDQCFFQQQNFTGTIGTNNTTLFGVVGTVAGVLAGVAVIGTEMAHTFIPLIEDNNRFYHYIPPMVMGATNLASAGFEIVNGIFQAGKRAGRKSLELEVQSENLHNIVTQPEKDAFAEQFKKPEIEEQ